MNTPKMKTVEKSILFRLFVTDNKVESSTYFDFFTLTCVYSFFRGYTINKEFSVCIRYYWENYFVLRQLVTEKINGEAKVKLNEIGVARIIEYWRTIIFTSLIKIPPFWSSRSTHQLLIFLLDLGLFMTFK